MRINPVSFAKTNSNLHLKNGTRLRESQPQLQTGTQGADSVSFKGLKGHLIGTTVGTLAGIGLGVLTGGLGTILLAGMAGCGVGSISGQVIEEKIKK